MSITRSYQFETVGPADLVVETQKGSVHLVAGDTAATQVRVVGADAREVIVEQHDNRIEVIGPRRRAGFFGGGDSALQVVVELPTGSNAAVHTGSADLSADGTLHSVQVRTGSGETRIEELTGSALIETGSGDVRIDHIAGELRVKSGSGDIQIVRAGGAVAVSTGSGDVALGTTAGPTVAKTGSGDLHIRETRDDVTLTTGSGDLAIGTAHRGRLRAKGASGDVRVGIPAGVAVWTDISTVSGAIRSEVRGTGEPPAGADHVELRANSVSGDIVLVEA